LEGVGKGFGRGWEGVGIRTLSLGQRGEEEHL